MTQTTKTISIFSSIKKLKLFWLDKLWHTRKKMSTVYPLNPGTMMRHHIEAADSTWHATFTETPNHVTYFHEGEMFQGTPDEFVRHHYQAVEPPRSVWRECEVFHEGAWKRNPTHENYVDLTEDIVLQPQVVEDIVLQPQVVEDIVLQPQVIEDE